MNSVRIEINTTKAQLNITTKIRRFRMERTPPKMKVTRRTPTFRVNWDKLRAESGLKKPSYLMRDTKQKAYNKVLNAIKQISREGDMIMEGTHPDSPDMIPYIARQNLLAALPEVNIKAMPESLPEVTWDKGEFEVTWTKGSLEIVWDEEFRPDINVTPHSVEIKIRDFKKVAVNDQGLRKHEGRKVDKRI